MEQEKMAVQPPVREGSHGMPDWHVISGSTLKMIAVITMFIDHLAAGVLGRYLNAAGWGNLDWSNMDAYNQWMEQNAALFDAYSMMRNIGRVAFPIYCFLLAEGLIHTKNLRKYTGRMLVFAFLSEIPFDLLFRGKWMAFEYQNVFFSACLQWLSWTGLSASSACMWQQGLYYAVPQPQRAWRQRMPCTPITGPGALSASSLYACCAMPGSFRLRPEPVPFCFS